MVADTGNNRVSVLSKEGKFLHFIGGKMHKGPDGKSHFLSDLLQPEDVSFHSSLDMVIIADTGWVNFQGIFPFC